MPKKQREKVELPLWLKKGLPVWVEIRDDQDIEILQYQEGIVDEVDFDTKDLKIKIEETNQIEEVYGDHVQERQLEHGIVTDLSDINIVNDAEILKHMEIRYLRDMIHCFCGPTMIVVNPYKRIESEVSDELKSQILSNLLNKELVKAPPHVWTISAIAWDNVFTQGVNQAICIQGESGAGKTESTKKCLEFITMNKQISDKYVSSKDSVENRIMQCNPILECVGNSKTARNDNSSRFGKYTVIYIDKESRQVKGSGIQPYLLEKSRVTHISTVERNYHIFYVMCQFLNDKMKKELFLTNNGNQVDMTKFKLLNKSPIYATPTVKDKEFYDDMMVSFQDLNFTQEQQRSVWALLSAILHFGNLTVDSSTFQEGKSACSIKNDQTWQELVKIMNFDGDLVQKALTNKQFLIGGQETIAPLSPDKVQTFVEVIARELYQRLFLWLIEKMNDQLMPKEKDPSNYASIGVLDIFGFEIFENNSLEQLFINFANEKLQGLFIEYIFKNECKIFKEEGLGQFVELITFKDNSDLVLALDNDKLPPGVFNLLDQNCMLNKTDMQYAEEMKKLHTKTERLKFPTFSGKGEFTVVHTARDVPYSTINFIEKNKDEVSQYLDNAIQTCQEDIKEIVLINEKLAAKDGGAKGKKNPKEKFLGYKFRQSMNSLINDLKLCFCQFIRCLKPNENKAKNQWNGALALRQIRYMGLLDSLKIRKNSFPYRMKYDMFYKMYQELDSSPLSKVKFQQLLENDTNFRQAVENFINNTQWDFSKQDVLFGITRIFMNLTSKIEIDKKLQILQKKKQESLDIIILLYKQKILRDNIKNYFISQYNGITIARNILQNMFVQIKAMRHKKFIKTAYRMQAIYRDFQLQKRIKHVKKQAMVIAKYYQLHQLSNVFSYMKNYNQNLTLIQSMIIQKIKKANYDNVQDTIQYILKLTFDKIIEQDIQSSSQNIQNAVRSYNLRKRQRKLTIKFDEIIQNMKQDQSVTQIQKLVRGFLIRRRYLKLKQAAERIQGFVKTKWLKNYFKFLRKSVLIIQKHFRAYQIKKKQKNALLLDYIIPKNEEAIKRQSAYKQLFKQPYQQQMVGFIPLNNQLDRQNSIKLGTFLIDYSLQYYGFQEQQQQWINNLQQLQEILNQKQQRIAYISIGGDFTLIITDNRDVYSFGANDKQQCLGIPSQTLFIELTQIQQFWQYPIKILSCGNSHSILIDEASNIYIWGSNEENQLGIDNTIIKKGIVKLNYIQEPIKGAIAKENRNYLLTESGSVIAFPWFNGEKYNDKVVDKYKTSNLKQNYIPKQINGRGIKIDKIAAGIDFIIAINKIGVLFTAGSNIFGELGQGDRNERLELTQVQYLQQKGEKVIEIACGNKHAVCQCFSNRIYVWGCNSNYQLGFKDRQPVLQPTDWNQNIPSKSKIKSISCGSEATYYLCEDRSIFFTGKSGQNINEGQPGLYKLEYANKLFQNRMLDRFAPIKINASFGRTMSVLTLHSADIKNNSDNVKTLAINLQQFKQIQESWKEKPQYIFPKQKYQFDKIMSQKYMIRERKIIINDQYQLGFKTQQIDINGTQNQVEEQNKLNQQNNEKEKSIVQKQSLQKQLVSQIANN